jgi:hypothetical protein
VRAPLLFPKAWYHSARHITFGRSKFHSTGERRYGCEFCLFARAHAEALGLSVEDGERLIFFTANSRFEAFGHELTMNVLGIENSSLVYFFSDPNITRNVLGRHGWLDRVRLGLIDHDQELYLAAYDEVARAGHNS